MLHKKIIDLIRENSFIIAELFNKIGITANQVTIGSFIIFTPMIFYCFSRGSYEFNVLGLFFLILRCYFDFVDGQVARLSNKASALGEWLDDSFDHFTIYGLIISVSWGLYKISFNSSVVWIVVIMLLGFLLLDLISLKYNERFNFRGIIAPKKLQESFNELKNKNYFDILVGNLIGFWYDATYFIFSFSYLFLLSVILDKIFLFFCFFTFTLYLRFFAMYFVYTIILSKKAINSRLFEFLYSIKDELEDR